jgi:hypothetical protein
VGVRLSAAGPLAAATFFVLLQSELHEVLLPCDARYRENYRLRHYARDFTGTGVVTLSHRPWMA